MEWFPCSIYIWNEAGPYMNDGWNMGCLANYKKVISTIKDRLFIQEISWEFIWMEGSSGDIIKVIFSCIISYWFFFSH